MKRYVIHNNETGNIDAMMSWGDNRDFPKDYPLSANQELIIVEDDSIEVNAVDFVYDKKNSKFNKKQKVQETQKPSIDFKTLSSAEKDALLEKLLKINNLI